jgi:uncharacterized protein YkwD/LysM repeat protein
MPLLLCRGMATTTTRTISQPRNLVWLTLSVILFGLWPHMALAQDGLSASGQAVFAAINQARVDNGLAPLTVNPLLNQAAQNHVNDMLTNYVYGHYGSDGSTVQTRVVRTGYSATPWVSENWVSASDASGAMRWWMNDYIHRVNILTSRWTEIGVGVGTRGSEMIFVTVFSAGGGTGSAAIAAVPDVPPQEAPPPPSVHIEQVVVPPEGLDYTVQGGDTLLAIGLRYGLPWERIAESNGLDETSLLQIGQVLRVPGSGTPPGPPPPPVETEPYTVQPNDTLYTIAARRGMYWDEVAVLNGFGEQTVLQIGQVIQVPVVEEAPVVETVPLVNIRQTPVGPVTADVVAGDFNDYTLKQIAQVDTAQTGTGGSTTQVALAQTPSVETTSVEIPSAEATSTTTVQDEPLVVAAAASTEAEPPVLYAVQSGDTIISIAVKHDLEWGPLLALNGLDENSVLQPGQEIRLR